MLQKQVNTALNWLMFSVMDLLELSSATARHLLDPLVVYEYSLKWELI